MAGKFVLTYCFTYGTACGFYQSRDVKVEGAIFSGNFISAVIGGCLFHILPAVYSKGRFW